MVLLCCNYIINCDSGTDWTTVISSSGAVAIGILALLYSNRQSKNALNAKKDEEKRIDINRKLNEFYGPLYQLRKKSNLIYEKFREKYNSDPNFSTLTYLLDGKKFVGNDAILLEEIIQIGKKCEELIHDKAGLIDDHHLRINIIPRATTHFLILRLAHQNALVGEVEKFRNWTFPKELDDLLEARRKVLEAELNSLNQKE